MHTISRRSLYVLALTLAVLVWTAPVRAATANPATFVNGLVQQALAILRNPQIPNAQREERFSTLLHTGFDIPRIARFVLGRYWLAASDQERDAFSRLFADWVVQTYSARFKEYSGETVKIIGSRQESPTSYVVSSQLIHANGAPPTTIYWHVHDDGNGLKIVDVEVEGVSMALTERDEIASVIQRSGGTVASLNQTLQQRLNVGATPMQAQSQ
jgi:phospholipid transport system substrate-binding protein